MFTKSGRILIDVKIVLYYLSVLVGFTMLVAGLILGYLWFRYVPGLSITSVSTSLAFALSLIFFGISDKIG